MKINKLLFVFPIALSLVACSDQVSNSGSDSTSGSAEPSFVYPDVPDPVLLSDKEISFGLYPKNVITDSETISKIEQSSFKKDNLIVVDERYYFKNAEGKGYLSTSGATINSGVQYYELEPIIWTILSKDNNNYFLISKEVIDSHKYGEWYLGEKDGVFASNYEHSQIREWLNNDFKNLAFNNSSVLQKVEVDNSLASTMKESNPYVCNNTFDYVFIPSVQDLTNPAYGFEDYGNGYSVDPNRNTTRTDFANSRQKFESSIDNFEHLGPAPYWTRTPYDKSLNRPDIGDCSGATVFSCIENGRVDVPSATDDDIGYYSLGGVRPCICITYDFGEFPHSATLPEQPVSYPLGSISSNELASIITRAVYIEKKYMSRVTIDDLDTIIIERFNGGYYHYHIKYPLIDMYVYSPNDFSHNFHCSTQDSGETYSSIGDYVSSDTDDQYSYAFGYGQLGSNPAAFLACQSGLIFESFEFNSFERTCKKHVESYFVSFKCQQIGGSGYFAFEMNINKYGGIDYLRLGVGTTQDVSILPESGGYKTIFGPRSDAPQFIVDLFEDYHD